MKKKLRPSAGVVDWRSDGAGGQVAEQSDHGLLSGILGTCPPGSGLRQSDTTLFDGPDSRYCGVGRQTYFQASKWRSFDLVPTRSSGTVQAGGTRHNSSIHIGGTGGEGALAGVGLAKKVAGRPDCSGHGGGGLLHGLPRCALGPGDGLWRGFWLYSRYVCGCRRSGWAQLACLPLMLHGP